MKHIPIFLSLTTLPILKAQSTWNGAGVDAQFSSASWDVALLHGKKAI